MTDPRLGPEMSQAEFMKDVLGIDDPVCRHCYAAAEVFTESGGVFVTTHHDPDCPEVS